MVRLGARYDLEELARRTQKNRASLDPLSFSSFDIENIRSILESGVEFRPEVPEADRRGLIWAAISKAGLSPEITARVLETALREQEETYLQKALRSFVLATSITLDPHVAPQAVSIDGGSILFSRRLPHRYSRKAIQKQLENCIHIEHPERLTAVRVPVRARTKAAAVDRAIERLDYWRSLWNYQINAKTALRQTFGTRPAVNTILLGPIHTLHSPGGRLATESFWYEPASQQSDKLPSLTHDISELRSTERILRQRIRSCHYASDLRHLLVRYTRALDATDYNVAFNSLWAVLENLVGAVGDYKTLIKRVAFLYDGAETSYARLLLEHLRDVRNGLVHESRELSGMETYLYQLKAFVEDVFRFHLSKPNHFSSLASATTFLDLPAEPSILADRIVLLRRAHRFRSFRRAV